MPVFKEAAAGDGLFWRQNLLHEKLGDADAEFECNLLLRSDFFWFCSVAFGWGVRQKKCGNLENWQLSATTITTAATKSFCCRQSFIFKGASSENRILFLFLFSFFLVCPPCHSVVWLSHLCLSLSSQRAWGALFHRGLLERVAESAFHGRRDPPVLVFTQLNQEKPT